MSNSIGEIIAVGMRYHNQAPEVIVRRYKAGKTSAVPVEIKLSIVKERNEKATGGYAAAVHIPKVDTDPFAGKKLAYIREADLSKVLKLMDSLDSETLVCTLRAAMPNYWVLTDVKLDTSLVAAQLIVAGAGIVINNTGTITNNPYVYADTTTGFQITGSNIVNSTIDKKENKMAIKTTNSMRDSFFREVSFVKLDIQSGKFGISGTEGIAVYKDGAIVVNPIQELGLSIPAFAVRVPVKDLKAGDIVISSNEALFFKSAVAEDGTYKVVNAAGEVRKIGQVTNLFFGSNTVLAVKNMVGDGEGAMNPMMLALMMGDSNGSSGGLDMKTFAMMSMMGGGKGMDNNMLMMMALMGK